MITINTDKSLLDLKFVHQFLTNSYWAKGRTIEKVKESIDNSLCFGMYLDGKQIGFARLVTDKVVFSYLMDVFIIEEHQGKEYGKVFVSKIYEHKDLKQVEKHYLKTMDAQYFYSKFGFVMDENPDRFMNRK